MPALLTDCDCFPFDSADRAALAAAGLDVVELPGHDPRQIDEWGRQAVAIFVYRAEFASEVIQRLECCRVLARCGAGYDNIDVVAAKRRGIEVVYVPDYGVDDVSDHALALLMACARKLVVADRAIRAGRWPSYSELAPLHRLRGQVLGLLGFGRIARALAKKGRALGLEIIAYDPFVAPEVFRDDDVRPVPRTVLFETSDFLSIHVPLSNETHHLVGWAELARMKPRAVVINTSRGPIVDGAALADALASGRLGGAGLDVFDVEPLSLSDPLRQIQTVVLSPHSAAYTEESLAQVRKRAVADVLRVLRGAEPLNPVP